MGLGEQVSMAALVDDYKLAIRFGIEEPFGRKRVQMLRSIASVHLHGEVNRELQHRMMEFGPNFLCDSPYKLAAVHRSSVVETHVVVVWGGLRVSPHRCGIAGVDKLSRVAFGGGQTSC